MSSNEIKPWTTQEMIENASNWSLAGDVGLLKYLQQFSENILRKTKETNDRLNDLSNTIDETTLSLNIVTNTFLGLKNTQFIESRVYEDDETLPTKPDPEPEPSKTDQERLEDMKNAVLVGLDVIDEYYEKVDIPESDSDEDLEESMLFRPIDPYADRPLPYVIGSVEWHKHWHVGLKNSSSESEEENEVEQFSETESEHEVQKLPVHRTQDFRDSDSETEEIPQNKLSRPVANSTFNDNTHRNIFDSSSSESETGSLPPQVNTVNSSFAEELAAKLGKVETEVNTRPIKKQPANNTAGLFFDEPPPLEPDNKDLTTGLFSGGSGLFDDDDENDFWHPKQSNAPKINPVSKQRNDKDDKKQDADVMVKKNKNKSEFNDKQLGLFDDEEDDLFSTPKLPENKKPILAPYKNSAPIFSDEPPELDQNVSSATSPKKPVGGISIFGPNALLNEHVGQILKHRVPSSSESEEDQKEAKPSAVKEETKLIKGDTKSIKKDRKPIKEDSKPIREGIKTIKEGTKSTKEEIKPVPSIFADSSPLFNDDIFGGKFSSGLFDSHDNLFSNKSEARNADNISKPTGLFDEDDDDLFAPPKLEHKSVNLFDSIPPDLDESDSKSESQSQLSFDNEPVSNYGSLNLGRASLFDTEPPMMSNESSGIVRDQSTSRLESEDSSFLPSLTSSRRHSDLFQEQNSDSLFTKPKLSQTDSNLFSKTDLSQIPEQETTTKIEITPSGHESSLFSNNQSESRADVSVFSNNQSASKPEMPLLADSDSFDDLFSTTKSNEFSPQQNNNNNLFKTKEEQNEKVDDRNEQENKSQEINKTVGNSDKLEKNDLKQELDDQTVNKEEVDGEILNTDTSPGKLKHTLNINVAALLPGAAPPRRPNYQKSISLDSERNLEVTKSPEDHENIKPIFDKSISFDQPVESNEVLSNVAKERVRIAVKRRPSSRRARQEAIRKSAADLLIEAPLFENEPNDSENSDESKLNKTNNNIVKTDENQANNDSSPTDNLFKDDLFNKSSAISLTGSPESEKEIVPRNDSDLSQNVQKIEQSHQLVPEIYPDLFSESTKIVPEIKDEDDLFSGFNAPKRTLDQSLFGKTYPKSDQSLFGNQQKTDLFNSQESTKDQTNSKFESKPSSPPEELETSQSKSKTSSDLFKQSNLSSSPPLFSHQTKSTEGSNVFGTNFASSAPLYSSQEPEKTQNKSKASSDLFKQSDLSSSPPKTETNSQPSTVKPKSEDINLFGSDSDNDDLFAVKQIQKQPDQSPVVQPPKTSKLLIRDDSLFEDEDLFSSKKLPPKSNILKKTLFDEDDDNDNDLFATPTTQTPKTSNTASRGASSKITPATRVITSLDNIDDPLDAFRK